MGTRTPDLLITNQLLYQLSYIGNSCFSIIGKWYFGVKIFMSNYSAKNELIEFRDTDSCASVKQKAPATSGALVAFVLLSLQPGDIALRYCLLRTHLIRIPLFYALE